MSRHEILEPQGDNPENPITHKEGHMNAFKKGIFIVVGRAPLEFGNGEGGLFPDLHAAIQYHPDWDGKTLKKYSIMDESREALVMATPALERAGLEVRADVLHLKLRPGTWTMPPEMQEIDDAFNNLPSDAWDEKGELRRRFNDLFADWLVAQLNQP